jgi:hypothetical protein
MIFSIYLILPAALGPEVYSASNGNEYQKIFWEGKERQELKTNDLTAICETTV